MSSESRVLVDVVLIAEYKQNETTWADRTDEKEDSDGWISFTDGERGGVPKLKAFFPLLV